MFVIRDVIICALCCQGLDVMQRDSVYGLYTVVMSLQQATFGLV